MIERADHRHFLGLSRRRHAQVRAALGPCARQIRMCQGLALVAIEENDVAGFGLGLAQLKAQPHALDLAGALAAFQRVAGPPPAEVFFRSALDSCDLRILTPSRASISVMRRGIVQLGRSATGASSRGVTTRSAASVFTGAGPGATLAFNASTPPSRERAAPQAHRVLAHAEGFRDPRAGPARQRQQDRPRPISLAAVARTR